LDRCDTRIDATAPLIGTMVNAREGEGMVLGAIDVVCVGNLVADLIVRPVETLPQRGALAMVDAIDLRAGGCALTTVVVLGRLGARASMLGMVGDDLFGRFLLEALSDAGVERSGVVCHPTVASVATVVLVDGRGERTYLHAPGVGALLTRDHLPDDLLFAGRALHIAGALINPGIDGEPTVHILEVARARGILTSLDTAYDPSGRWERVHAAIPHLDIFAPGYPEAKQISGRNDPVAIAAWARELGAQTAIIKLGADGAYVDAPEYQGFVSPIRVNVVDATGAGESFNGGLLYGLIAGWPLERAVRLGTATGALAVTQIGAAAGATSLPTALAFAGLEG
jgi:sugar/nucleoside kinase (ribokinase family)